MAQELEYVRNTFEEYLSDKSRISASDIKNFWNSPAYYYYKKYEEKKGESARHFFVGTALHCLLLEPHLFARDYSFIVKYDMRTKEGKEKDAEAKRSNEGKLLLYTEEWEMIEKMSFSALQNNTFTELIKKSERELSIYTTDEKTGLKIKMRPDSLSKIRSTITDLKTCQDSSKRKFRYDVFDFGYHITAAFYMDFSMRENYVFAALEKQEPYQVGLYMLSDELIMQGRNIYRTSLALLEFCYRHSVWPTRMEFEVLKQAYNEGDVESYFDRIRSKHLIQIIS